MTHHNPRDLERMIRRLFAGHGRSPKDSDVHTTLDTWLDVMRGVPLPELEAAVEAEMQNPGHWFPKPAAIRAEAMKRVRKVFTPGRREHIEWHVPRHWPSIRDSKTGQVGDPDTGYPGPCPKCLDHVEYDQVNGTWHAYLSHRAGCTFVAEAAA